MTCAFIPANADQINDIDVLQQFLKQNYPNETTNTSDVDTLNQFNKVIDSQAAIVGPLLSSQAAVIYNNDTGEILYQKNADKVMSIASISKLMSAMVLLDANLDMNEMITITDDEIDRIKGTSSRLSIGTTLSRKQLLHIGLMSSENRAIHALGRTYPGGMSVFVKAMNNKALSLGLSNTKFYEPTGLDHRNVSTANELIKLAAAASQYPQIRINTTSNSGSVVTSTGVRQNYSSSNALVREGIWNIELQKTGYIRESGRSMIVRAKLLNKPITIVLLNSPSSLSRANDARHIQTWMQKQSF